MEIKCIQKFKANGKLEQIWENRKFERNGNLSRLKIWANGSAGKFDQMEKLMKWTDAVVGKAQWSDDI